MDWKGRYADNIFLERLWRRVKYKEVYLKVVGSTSPRSVLLEQSLPPAQSSS